MFDKDIFTREVKRLHLTSDEERAYFDALEDATAEAFVDEVFDLVDDVNLIKGEDKRCKNSPKDIARFKLVLGQINENYVGHTLFKLLKTKLHFPFAKAQTLDPNAKIRIVHDNTNVRPGKGGAFFTEQLAAVVKFMYYDDDGAGLLYRQYCVVDLSKGNQVVFRKKSLVGSIFHELTHALHWISGTWSNEISNTLWQSKEERHTISGVRDNHEHDIICDYCFEKYNSIMPINPALGRDGQFRPRLGHRRFPRVDENTPPNIPLDLQESILPGIEEANNNVVRLFPWGIYLWNNCVKHLLFCSTLACCNFCSVSFGTTEISQEFHDACNKARPYATTFESV
jgi:hypothetical protein